MATRVRVVSYNVLSSHLASPGYFTACAAENLEAPARLRRVLAKLEPETANESVICLQEISTAWAGKMHVFFEKRGYTFVTANYGNYRNGWVVGPPPPPPGHRHRRTRCHCHHRRRRRRRATTTAPVARWW